jgi:hypothetical protein
VRLLPWFLVLIALGFWAIPSQVPPDQIRIGIIVCASLSAGVLSLLLEFTYARASWSESGLMYRSPWRKSRTVNWEDVVEVGYSPRLSWVTIRDRSGTVIRLSTLLGGLTELLQTLKLRTDPALHASIAEALMFLRVRY